ncbi:MAG: LamG domain-containing protein, partial [Phycisphaerales bacterium]
HDVYFGTDRDAVANADASDTTGIYRGRQVSTSFSPAEVEMGGGPYYWRIDEINNDGTITTGRVWNFSVTDYILVEDFESYNDIEAGQPDSNPVYSTWKDGVDNPNVNGSTMGYFIPFEPTMESDRVHDGHQSAPMAYNNTTAPISEVTRTFAAQDWTGYGVQTLSLWFFGDVNNVPGQLYVKVNGVKVDYDGAAANLTVPAWHPWNIELAALGVNLRSVTSMVVGMEGPFARGTLLLDDIRLYPYPRELITPVQPDPNGLVAQYAFEGNLNDSIGGHHGTANGDPVYAPGKFDQAISLDGIDDYIVIGSVGISDVQPRTIAGWAKASILGTPAWVNVFGFTGPSGNNGHFDIELVGDSSSGGSTLGWYGLHVYGWQQDILPIDFEWHHLAASYDGMTLKWYGDGMLIGTEDRVINPPDNVHIGKREDNDNFFPGLVDDVRIYNRVLSDAELAGLAGKTEPFDKGF